MTTLAVEIEVPSITGARVSEDTLAVDLADGRTLLIPLGWFPRLEHASLEERANWRLIGNGLGLHWADIDEDLSVEGLLSGRPSGESQQSFKRWLQRREPQPTVV